MTTRFLLLGAALLAAAACSDDGAGPSLSVATPKDTVQVDETVQLTLGGAGAATWTSSDPSVATVDDRGLVTARFPGRTTVVAQSGGARDSVPLTVASVVFPWRGAGSVPARWSAEVAARGRYAYTTSWGTRTVNGVASRGNAIYVWDVSHDAPSLVDTVLVADPTVTTLGDVQVSDDGALLVVATERTSGSILVYSLADPAHPALLARHRSANTSAGVHTAKLARVGGTQYAFLSIDPGSAGLVIVDLSTPSAPVEVLARRMGNPYLHDVFVRDGLLFTAEWDDGVRIWDIGGGARGGTVANPQPIGQVTIPGGAAHNVRWVHDSTTGAKRWLAIGQELPGAVGASSSGDVFVADVTDLAHPQLRATYRLTGAGTHNFDGDERRGVLYAAYYNGGVRALDVRGDLGACADAERTTTGLCDLMRAGREVGHFSVPALVYIWGVQRVGTTLYASDMLSGLWAIDVSRLRR